MQTDFTIRKESKLRTYIKGSTAGAISKAISVTSSFFNLWFLNQILSKDQFGSYAFAISVITLASILFTLGQDRAIFFRLAGLSKEEANITGANLVYNTIRRILIYNMGMLLILLSVFFMPIEGFKSHLFWLICLSATIPASVVNQILISWFQSQQRFIECLIVPRVEDIARTLLLLAAFLWWPNRSGTVLSIIASSLITLIVWFSIIPSSKIKSRLDLSSKDFFYGLKLMLTKIVHIGMEKVDILLLGFLTSKLIIAEYSVASKFALFAFIGNELFVPIFTPRMRKYIVAKQKSSLLREYQQTRLFSLVFTMVVSVFVIYAGPIFLSLFGEYQGAQRILLILIAGGIVKMGYGPSGRYLNMAGYVSASLTLTLILLLSNGILCYFMIPKFFGVGAALSTYICLVAYNTSMAMFIWHKDHFPTLDLWVMAIIFLSSTALILMAFGIFNTMFVGLFISLLILLQIWIQRSLWLPLFVKGT